MPCDLCGNTRWLLLDEEREVGFVYGPCPKCCYSVRGPALIPAPVDALAFVSNSKRIVLGEDAAWRQHAKEEET